MTNINLIIKRILTVTSDNDLRRLILKYNFMETELKLIRRQILKGRRLLRAAQRSRFTKKTDNLL